MAWMTDHTHRSSAKAQELNLTREVDALTDTLQERTEGVQADRILQDTSDALVHTLIEGGLNYSDVSRLCGMPESTVRKHYRRHESGPPSQP